ncbi:DUF397 domain-containing protein [Streptomyces sp. H27-D2]|uniref:DUF397 domain-containing protein n=1 Tax=Streptomyces sp. H27-D2 TaxID=3046304 RepID=UPI002DB78B33|nr:DUF397 domain-containing protein [Streptomyces sp. H27-D2]MEC4017304.1 DUF397 domain-containing protein [Streptomyces sp. H27-D2]
MFTPDWQKSSHSAEAANCLYVAAAEDGTIRLRESDAPGVILAATTANLRTLIHAVKDGQFDHLTQSS